jgi:hypothetical protein
MPWISLHCKKILARTTLQLVFSGNVRLTDKEEKVNTVSKGGGGRQEGGNINLTPRFAVNPGPGTVINGVLNNSVLCN